ncbi:MAG: hypothetical protein WAN16_02675 [Chthoniobacterales bacterium]
MSTPESDPHTEVLKSIAASLKGIQASLDHLTGAVEGVAESIEKAHEPEGDLGVHLVGALKDLTSALHKRAQQERSHQPQQGQHRQNLPRLGPGRRDDRQQHRQENRDRHDDQEHSRHDESGEPETDTAEHPEERDEAPIQDAPATEQGDQPRKNANRGRGRGRRGGKPPAKQAPKE